MTAPIKPPDVIRATWRGEHRFDTGRAGATTARLDGSGLTGPTPPDLLMGALAGCSGIDVVDILAKRRTPVEALEIEVTGQRQDAQPRRFLTLDVTYRVTGPGVDRAQAERAVSLAFEKYCSVASSLAPDIVAHTIVVLNGEVGERIQQAMGR